MELPLVLPPAVAGIGLFAAFGRTGLFGSTLDALGLQIPFTLAAVVFAVALVASPLYVRTAIAAFEAVDPDLVAASRTLGAGPAKTFFRVALPLARPGSRVRDEQLLGENRRVFPRSRSGPRRDRSARPAKVWL